MSIGYCPTSLDLWITDVLFNHAIEADIWNNQEMKSLAMVNL